MALWAWLRQDGMGSGRLKVDPWPASGQGKGEGFGSGLRPSGDEVRFGAASRAPRQRYWGVRAGEMVRSRARVCVRVRC
jgi:hypothetical protein